MLGFSDMKKLLLALFLFFSPQAYAQNLSFGAGGGGSSGITAGTTTVTGCSTLQLFYNDSSNKFNCMSGTSWDDTNRSLTITGATVTTNNPVLELTQTWNDGGQVFKGISLDISNTTSNILSGLISLGTNGNTHFRVGDGFVWLGRGITPTIANYWLSIDSNLLYYYNIANSSGVHTFQVGGNNNFSIHNGSVITRAANLIGWSGTTSSLDTQDTILGRNAAASLRLGAADAAAPVAQTLGVQSVVAGTTNTAGVNWTLRGSTSTGSGVSGDIILQTGGTGAGATSQNSFVTALTIKGATQQIVAANSVQTTCTTVTGLGAAGTAGRNWCVTDQLTACPALGGTFTGGGAVTCKAFDNGTAWVHE